MVAAKVERTVGVVETCRTAKRWDRSVFATNVVGDTMGVTAGTCSLALGVVHQRTNHLTPKVLGFHTC